MLWHMVEKQSRRRQTAGRVNVTKRKEKHQAPYFAETGLQRSGHLHPTPRHHLLLLSTLSPDNETSSKVQLGAVTILVEVQTLSEAVCNLVFLTASSNTEKKQTKTVYLTNHSWIMKEWCSFKISLWSYFSLLSVAEENYFSVSPGPLLWIEQSLNWFWQEIQLVST